MTSYEGFSLIFTLLSIIAGPTIGIQLQKRLEKKRRCEDQKDWVFSTLMATRMERAGYRHVEALNSILLAFHTHNKKSKEQKVLNRWSEYHAVLCEQNLQEKNIELWISKKDAKFIDLLYEMSECLGYVYNREEIERGGYSPMAHGTLEQNQLKINEGLAKIVSGEKSLLVKIQNE